MRVEALTGPALEDALDGVGRLRLAVFRDWPYLYDGTLEYEQQYLQHYRNNPRAVIAGAFDGDTLVGAATGTPMEDHSDDFAAAFAPTGLSLSDIFYCAESVLLPEYRGRGVGHRFFDIREAKAAELGRKIVAFCSVLRSTDHSSQPTDYRPLDVFWRKRGYEPLPGAIATFRWKDRGDDADTAKNLQFWTRTL